jgi:predicted permease
MNSRIPARWRLWWRSLRQRRQFETELEAELEFHLQARSDDLVRQGWSPDAAQRQARIDLGQREMHRDGCRQARGLAWADRLRTDLRHAVRGLVQHPGYSATALGVLGIAIAANAVLFALFNAYALRSPPLPQLDRWVAVDARNESARVLDKWTPQDADRLLRDPPPMFEGLYAFRGLRLPVRAAVTRTVSAESVSDNYFELLGVHAARGRVFRAAGEEAAQPGVVLSDLGWRRLTHADEDVVGRSLEIAGRRFEVIGVMPPEFTGLSVNSSLLWLREADYRTLQLWHEGHPLEIDVGGFLREGASADAAAAALTPRMLADNPARDETLRLDAVRVEARRGFLRADERAEIVALGIPVAIAFAMLLLVAAANLANLVLARFAARQRELAVRIAVGAPRRRLVAQLATESALLAVIAAVLGFVVAWLALAPINAALFGLMGELGYDLIDVAVDGRVLLYGLGLSLLAAFAFGGVPALIATAPWGRGRGQPDPAGLQRSGRSRLRGALMVTQLVASVVLLVIASLAAINARRAEQIALGYDPTRLIALRTPAATPALVDALTRLPEVEAVGATSSVFLMSAGARIEVRVGDRSEAMATRRVDAAYFDALQLDALQGRVLRRSDEAGNAVVAISRRTAERLWPGEGALGRTIEVPPQETFAGLRAGRYEVIGVIEDVVGGWYVNGIDASALYFPAAAGDPDLGSLMLRVRDASPIAQEAIRTACARAAPTQNCELMPLTSAFRFQRMPFVIASSVAAALGWTALGISCLGLYGLVSYLMLQKRREIGVRLALGASSQRVARQMLAHSARQVALGLALGLPIAFAAAQVARSLSPQLALVDPFSFGIVPLALAALALAAAWIPARRTAEVRPTEALRQE